MLQLLFKKILMSLNTSKYPMQTFRHCFLINEKYHKENKIIPLFLKLNAYNILHNLYSFICIWFGYTDLKYLQN